MPEATIAAERCRQVAEQLAQPVPLALALADWARAHAALSSGSFARALILSGRAADDLEHHVDAKTAPEVLGMLHLSAATAVLSERRTDDAFGHVVEAEAERIAAGAGETTSWGHDVRADQRRDLAHRP